MVSDHQVVHHLALHSMIREVDYMQWNGHGGESKSGFGQKGLYHRMPWVVHRIAVNGEHLLRRGNWNVGAPNSLRRSDGSRSWK